LSSPSPVCGRPRRRRPLRVATRTIGGLYDGATTEELDRLLIQSAAELIAEEPAYLRLAARLLAAALADEAAGQGVTSFRGGSRP
jgi:ribonucleoside-diphosphate reductase alpha chain